MHTLLLSFLQYATYFYRLRLKIELDISETPKKSSTNTADTGFNHCTYLQIKSQLIFFELSGILTSLENK